MKNSIFTNPSVIAPCATIPITAEESEMLGKYLQHLVELHAPLIRGESLQNLAMMDADFVITVKLRRTYDSSQRYVRIQDAL